MQSLKGKTALITGAGRGLGKAMALALAAEGVNLALIGRTQKTLDETVSSARNINENIIIHTGLADVASYEEVKTAIEAIKSKFQTIDILINNAGVLVVGSILEIPVEEWERSLKINMLGTYYVVREVLPLMIAQNQGNIINIASTAGLKGGAKMSAYGASKAAVINFTESLMQEVRKSNIRVTTVNPSTIATDMTLDAKFTDGNVDKVLQPEDLALIIVHNLKLPQRAFVKDFSLWSTNP